MDIEQSCRTEVAELHAFFAEWFGGSRPDTDEAFARFADALASSFTMVVPDGRTVPRDAVLKAVRDSHGWGATTIWIENHVLRFSNAGVALVGYEEWQTRDDATRGRASTAFFAVDPAAPNGVRWMHVHETWLPDERPEA